MVAELAPAEDRELLKRAGRGDSKALGVLYERYAAPLFDFVVRTVRDAHLADDIVQITFVKAWQSAGRSGPVKNPKAWLFTIARNAAIDELRRRAREVHPDPAQAEFVLVDLDPLSDPEQLAGEREIVELVWAAARSLSTAEYSLLDLHVRQGFSPAELAAEFRTPPNAMHQRLWRLRRSMEEAVSAELLRRQGRTRCPELDTLVSRFTPATSPETARGLIADHLRVCASCEETKRKLVAPINIFAGLPPVPLAVDARRRIWTRIEDDIRRSPLRRRVRTRRYVGAAAITALIAFILAILLAQRTDVLPAVDPADVHSPTHDESVASTDPIVVIEWTPAEGSTGFSIAWSHEEPDLPDQIPELAGDASRTVSDILSPGEWYFSLRTRGRAGDWTSTVQLRFVIAPAAEAGPGSVSTRTVPPPPATLSPAPTTEPPPTTLSPAPTTEPPPATVPPAPTTEPPPPTTQPPPPTTEPPSGPRP